MYTFVSSKQQTINKSCWTSHSPLVYCLPWKRINRNEYSFLKESLNAQITGKVPNEDGVRDILKGIDTIATGILISNVEACVQDGFCVCYPNDYWKMDRRFPNLC